MSDASRHKMYAVAESEYGTTPDTPTMDAVRITGTTLGLSKSPQTSEELRSDRQIVDFRHGTKQVGGDISFELSYGTFDKLLEAALGGTWVPKQEVVDSTISAANADSSFNDSGDQFGDFEVGDIIIVSGFSEGANNGNFKVASVLDGKLTVTDVDDVAVVLADDAAGDEVTITTQDEYLSAGTTRRSYSFMRHFTDQLEADKPFYLYTGCEVNTMALNVTPDALLTGSFSVIGKGSTVSGTAPAGSTLNDPSTTKVFNAFGGVVKEDGTAIGTMTEIALSLENGMEPRFVIGSDETLQPSIGRSTLTGTVGIYFDDSSMVEKFYNETYTSIEFTTADPSGNEYTFFIPNISLTGGQPDTSGQGSITLSVPFQALMDAVLGTQIRITRRAVLA